MAYRKEFIGECANAVSPRPWPKYDVVRKHKPRKTQEPAETEPVLEEERRPARSPSVKLAQVGRRAQKLDRDAQVVELHHQGVKAADIASRVGIGERTVHRWLAHGSFPEARRRRRRPSLIDPYERYVFQWWQEGHRNGLQLYRELKAQGYKGSSKAMYNYLATLRAPQSNSSKSSPLKAQERKSVPLSPALLENFSARRARLSVRASTR